MVVEDPPLAQALYHAVDIGEEIPEELYQAVAQVLAYVYRLSGRMPLEGVMFGKARSSIVSVLVVLIVAMMIVPLPRECWIS